MIHLKFVLTKNRLHTYTLFHTIRKDGITLLKKIPFIFPAFGLRRAVIKPPLFGQFGNEAALFVQLNLV